MEAQSGGSPARPPPESTRIPSCVVRSRPSLCSALLPEGKMPLPKSLLRRPVRRTSSSSSVGQNQRQRCRTCNNLDPRGHSSSVQPDEGDKDAKTRLTLVIDALTLSQTKDVSRKGCRFCNVLIQALDAFFEKWRGARTKVNVEIVEKATVKVSMDGERWKGEIIEIYAGSGKFPILCTSFQKFYPIFMSANLLPRHLYSLLLVL